MSKYKYEFGGNTAVDFEIIEDGKVKGSLRVKPSTILWKNKNAKGSKPWKSLSIDLVADYICKYGKASQK